MRYHVYSEFDGNIKQMETIEAKDESEALRKRRRTEIDSYGRVFVKEASEIDCREDIFDGFLSGRPGARMKCWGA